MEENEYYLIAFFIENKLISFDVSWNLIEKYHNI